MINLHYNGIIPPLVIVYHAHHTNQHYISLDIDRATSTNQSITRSVSPFMCFVLYQNNQSIPSPHPFVYPFLSIDIPIIPTLSHSLTKPLICISSFYAFYFVLIWNAVSFGCLYYLHHTDLLSFVLHECPLCCTRVEREIDERELNRCEKLLSSRVHDHAYD
jgi:hypothetical protein